MATLLVFTFVALWHDLHLRLLAWGWLVSVFVLPEILASRFCSKRIYGLRPWYRHVAALGAVANIAMLIIANMVGFVFGLSGISDLIRRIFKNTDGLKFLLTACLVLWFAAQIMFEYRASEQRQGIFRRC